MGYAPITSFRRTVDAAQILRVVPPVHLVEPVNKWQVLRELTTARKAFGVTDRDLTILQALLSFHPNEMLEGSATLIVYPSNASICERLHGMPCSTMRRHLGNLVSAGLILRRDSPNGKRYVRRGGSGSHAFGFDLRPLAERFTEITTEARSARLRDQRLSELRESVSLMRRDLAGLAEHHMVAAVTVDLETYTALTLRVARDLRRKLSENELLELQQELAQAIASLHNLAPFGPSTQTAQMSTSDAKIEQHYQNHNKERKDSRYEPTISKKPRVKLPIRLETVLATCHELLSYSLQPIRHWRDLTNLAEQLRPMTAISLPAWENAKRVMGVEEAAVTLAAMLERFREIRNPSAYLARLSSKAATGKFTAAAMLNSLRHTACSQLSSQL